ELDDRRLRAVGEVGIAVAELLGQVETESFGKLDGARDSRAILREALDELRRSEQHTLVVASPFGLAAVERAAVANGDEDVLERRTALMVGVDVARDERRDAERF